MRYIIWRKTWTWKTFFFSPIAISFRTITTIRNVHTQLVVGSFFVSINRRRQGIRDSSKSHFYTRKEGLLKSVELNKVPNGHWQEMHIFWETSLSGKVFLVKELTFPGINNFYNRNNFPLKQLFLENQLLIVFDFNTSCHIFFLRIPSVYTPWYHITTLPTH